MIKKEEVQHIAKLARIKLTEQELKKFQKELSSILDYFESLKKADLSSLEPTFHPAEHFFKKKLGTMRKDKSKSQEIKVVDKLVKSAPESKKGYIKVKAVL